MLRSNSLCASLVLWILGAGILRAESDRSRYQDVYPKAASKKGLQVELVDDALALGIKHAAVNVNLARLVVPAHQRQSSENPTWTQSDKQYQFDFRYLQSLDRRIRALSDAGVLVNVILLVYESNDPQVNRLMLHPAYDNTAPNRLGAFNTVTPEGRAWLTATLEFIAERWSRPDGEYGRVVGYIVGNEVNSHWFWSNRGRATMEEFAEDYLVAVRLVHSAVRRQASWPRVYVSLDHHWNHAYEGGDSLQTFRGKEFVDFFAQRARETKGGDFDWHVAYHPYPENLFEPKFWEDQTALPHADTPRITFKNLEVLTAYLRRPELLFDGQPRRVILSEQGFHTPDGPEGEIIQAAAYCYAYRKVEKLEGIDAFILHRHVDHPNEGGLRLGLRSRSQSEGREYPAKKIYACFQHADTPEWKQTFDFALPVVGLDSWQQLK